MSKHTLLKTIGLTTAFITGCTATPINTTEKSRELRGCDIYIIYDKGPEVLIDLKDQKFRVQKDLYSFFERNMDDEDWDATTKINRNDLGKFLDYLDADKNGLIDMYDATSIVINSEKRKAIKDQINIYLPGRID